jgi:hypothetical protein
MPTLHVHACAAHLPSAIIATAPTRRFAGMVRFPDRAVLALGDGSIRYLAPPDIQGDSEVRVVFFKSSLNTGCDCPRSWTGASRTARRRTAAPSWRRCAT